MKAVTRIRAFFIGFRDGWAQPHDLSTSTNVEHLPDYDYLTQEWLDTGINYGQLIRSPWNHQPGDFRYMFPPLF